MDIQEVSVTIRVQTSDRTYARAAADAALKTLVGTNDIVSYGVHIPADEANAAALAPPELKRHVYDVKLREGKWEVEISTVTAHGYYEHDAQGEGGSLTFEGKRLVDFDGRSCLPRDVATALLKAGYELEHTEYVGERITVADSVDHGDVDWDKVSATTAKK